MGQFTMVIACILTFLATVTSISGHPCLSKFTEAQRPCLNMLTGVVLLLSGIMVLIGTSWAVNACQNNYVTLKGQSMNFGNFGGKMIMAYTVGWSCILAMAASILCILVCGYAFKKYFSPVKKKKKKKKKS